MKKKYIGTLMLAGAMLYGGGAIAGGVTAGGGPGLSLTSKLENGPHCWAYTARQTAALFATAGSPPGQFCQPAVLVTGQVQRIA